MARFQLIFIFLFFSELCFYKECVYFYKNNKFLKNKNKKTEILITDKKLTLHSKLYINQSRSTHGIHCAPKTWIACCFS